MSHPSRYFWGAAFVLAGLVFLAATLQIISLDIAWKIIGPMVILLLGLWLILGATRGRNRQNVVLEPFSTPLADITSARVEITHGAGKFDIGIAGNPENLVEGECAGGVEQRVAVKDGFARLELKPRTQEFWDSNFRWNNQGLALKLGLSPKVPLDVILKTGADETIADLSGLNVKNLTLETGASSNHINLPEKVEHMNVKVSAGAASISIKVPQSLAARIHIHSGISGKKIDLARFPQKGSNYESPDFETSPYKAEINIETGVSSVEIL